MYKKIFIYILILSTSLFFLSGCSNSKNNINDNSTNMSITQTSKKNLSEDSSSSDRNEKKETTNKPTEEDLSVFSTPIVDKVENRQNNIRICINSLNGYTLESGKTFSFCDIVGDTTADKGYKEADILVDGEIEQALGGGICQVSTTVYNAALAVEGLTITEKHDHEKKVPYIEKGKDATVSYGLLNLKFKNDLPFTIKLYVSTDGNNVTARIVKII